MTQRARLTAARAPIHRAGDGRTFGPSNRAAFDSRQIARARHRPRPRAAVPTPAACGTLPSLAPHHHTASNHPSWRARPSHPGRPCAGVGLTLERRGVLQGCALSLSLSLPPAAASRPVSSAPAAAAPPKSSEDHRLNRLCASIPHTIYSTVDTVRQAHSIQFTIGSTLSLLHSSIHTAETTIETIS